jgi:hypothetical protein
MTNNDPQFMHNQQNVNLLDNPSVSKAEPVPEFSETVPVQHSGLKKTNKKHRIIIAIALGIFAFCCLAALLSFIYSTVISVREKRPIEQVLDSYMYAMSVKSAEGAYALLSPRAKQQNSLRQIQELLEGNYFVLVKDYERVSISTWRVAATVNSDPLKPQGTVAIVSGTIYYRDGSTGTFNGILEKIDDEWRIYDVSVSVPPEKFK